MEKLKNIYLRYERGKGMLDMEANGQIADCLTCDVEGRCRVVSNEDMTCVYMTVDKGEEIK